jgi:hypothetical protein
MSVRDDAFGAGWTEDAIDALEEASTGTAARRTLAMAAQVQPPTADRRVLNGRGTDSPGRSYRS